MEDNKIRILNIVPNMRAAGIETFIMNIYRNIDRDKIQFDFIVHSSEKKDYDNEIEMLGGKIYRFSFKDDKNIIKYIKDLNKFFKNHKEYKIVHGHMQSMMPLYLLIAKLNKIPVRIAHSHNNGYEKSIKGFILHVFSRLVRCFSNVNLACSKESGKYSFGRKQFKVIYNGIDIQKFTPNLNIRNAIREELNCKDKFVVGNIGRFEKQKNQIFLIDIFNEILKKDKNSVLLLFGEGKLEKKLKDKVKKLDIEDKVMFLGIKNNIQDYINAFDAFVLPSLYEGLGIVLIENQYMGKKVYTSKSVVAEETNISNLIKYINLEESAEKWANIIYNDRFNIIEEKIVNNCFDIITVSNNLMKYYVDCNEELNDGNIHNSNLE